MLHAHVNVPDNWAQWDFFLFAYFNSSETTIIANETLLCDAIGDLMSIKSCYKLIFFVLLRIDGCLLKHFFFLIGNRNTEELHSIVFGY